MLAPTPDEVRYIYTEVFPASYTLNGVKSTDQLKAIVTSDHLVIYMERDMPVFVSPLISYTKVSYKEHIVETEAGTVTIIRENNCGCGNRLRGYFPYQGKPHVAHYPFLKGT